MSVSIYNKTSLVGSHGSDESGSRSGSAYLFEPDKFGKWNQTKLLAHGIEGNFQFGRSVSIFDKTIVIGAYGDNHAGGRSGAIHIFE